MTSQTDATKQKIQRYVLWAGIAICLIAPFAWWTVRSHNVANEQPAIDGLRPHEFFFARQDFKGTVCRIKFQGFELTDENLPDIVEKLQRLPDLRTVHFYCGSCPNLSDDGLMSLAQLPNLTHVYFGTTGETRITRQGIERLQQALPKCVIVPPFDVPD